MRASGQGAALAGPWWVSERATGPVTEPEVVSGSLKRAQIEGAQSAVLELEKGWPMPKVPLMLLFRDTRDSSGPPRWWTLHVVSEGRLPYPLRVGLQQQRATHLEELGAVVQKFPDDLLLNGVAEATDARAALPIVSSALPVEAGAFDALEAEVLTYKPGRRLTIRYRLHWSADVTTTVYGKCFPGGVDEQISGVTEALQDHVIRDQPAALRLPRVVGRVSRWNMLLWKSRPGVSVHDLLGTERSEKAVEIAGQCLAELHRSSIDWPRVHDRSREIETLRAWIKAVATADVVGGGRIYRAFQRLMDWEPDEGDLVPSHRDFYDKQLLIDGRQGSLLDLETATRAEPELDAANFLAHLELRVLQGRRFGSSGLTGRFIDSYTDARSELHQERLLWYRASTLLRLSCVYFFRTKSRELADRLLVEACEALGEDRFTMN